MPHEHHRPSPSRLLAERIRQIGLAPGEPLPSIRTIAARFGVGRGTASGAVKRLAAHGWIVKRRYGSGYVRATPHPPPDAPTTLGPRSVSDHIVTELRASIVDGDYESGELVPTVKELRHRFGCTYAPVARALTELERRGLVRRRGRGYEVSTHASPPARGTSAVYFFGPPSSFRPDLPATTELLAPLERELQKLGWGPVRYYIRQRPTLATVPPRSKLAGIVTAMRDNPEHWERILAHYRDIPLVTFDPWEALGWSAAHFTRHVSYHSIVPDNRAAGASMARLAVASGHRQIAFFTPTLPTLPTNGSSRYNWLLLRLEGVASVLGPREPEGRWELISPVGNEDTPPALSRSRSWWGVRSDLFVRRWVPPESHRIGVHAFEMLHSLASIAHTLESSFRATLERGRATFWLCANDAVAVAATSFLHRHGVSVPHDIEVAGFDNSPFAFAQRITSYDFGTDRAGVIAARCLANPDWSPRDPDGFIRLPGRVVVRETASGSGTHTGKTSMEGRDGGRGEPFGGP